MPLSTIYAYLSSFRRTRLLAEFHGHGGPVFSLAISPNGKMLASGGVDGVRVWNLETNDTVLIPQQPLHERGQVSCVCWVTRQNEAFDTLCYGNALGFLVFLQHRPTERRFEPVHSVRIARGGEILALAADATRGNATRIATGTRDKCVQVWSFDSSSRKLVSVHSNAFGQEKDIIPKGLAFDVNEKQDLYVFGLYDGGLHKYDGADGKWISTHQLGSKIGNAAVDMERRFCVIDNVNNGFDMYKIDSGNFVRTLVTRAPIKTYPKGVAFVNHAQAVVGGSDHGHVYIFERKSGRMITTLKHGKDEEGVQTIGVHDRDDTVVIATASSSTPGPNVIRLWLWRPVSNDGTERWSNQRWAFVRGLEWLLKLLITMAALAYVIDIFRGQTFHMAYITGGMKELPKESEYGVMRDYIRRQMAAEFDAMMAQERWLNVPLKRIAGLEPEGRGKEQAAAKEPLHANREPKTAGFKQDGKSGRGIGQQTIKEMPVILI